MGLAQTADGRVWAAWSQSDAVAPVRADGTAGKPVAVGRTPLRLVELDGMLWVTSIRDGGLSQVDPAGSTVVRTVNLGEQPEGLAALGGHLFVVVQEGAALVEVDPADGAQVRRYDVGGEPRMLDGTVWAARMTDDRVAGLDPRTLAVTHHIDVPRDPDGLAAGAGSTLGGKANNDVLERDGTAFLSDYAGNRVEIVRLDAS